MPIRAVFFDLGGTLFAYSQLREPLDALLGRLLARHDIQAPASTVRRAYREAMARQFASFATRDFYLHRDLFEAAHRDFLSAFGAAPAPDDGLGLFYEGQAEIGMDAVRPRARAAETLAGLRERDLYLGVVSNIDDDQFHPLWQRIGLGGYFDATTTSEEARSCKPDRRIFEYALGKAAGIAAPEVLFVGDSPVHDVAGARALGMQTVLIAERSFDFGEGPAADHVIRELPELLAIVEG